MGNKGARYRIDQIISDVDVSELSRLTGLSEQKVREWQSTYLVCINYTDQENKMITERRTDIS